MADATISRVTVESEEMYPISIAPWRMDKRDKVYHIGVRVLTVNFPFDIDIVMQCGLVVPEGKVGNWHYSQTCNSVDCTPLCRECETLAIMVELSE